MSNFNYLNRCIWTAASGGTGNFVVGGAVQNGYAPADCVSPAVIDGGVYHYFATYGVDHEEGDGIYTVSTTTLTRGLIRNSSNSGAAVDFSGVPTVYMGGTIAADLTGAFTTGDVKLTIKTTADIGWVMMNDGTIGSASSGATTRANDDCEDLYTAIWDGISDTYAPVTGGRGASAAADWAANKPIALQKILGRALAVGGTGSGLSPRALGQTLGQEDNTLVTANLAPHVHSMQNHYHSMTHYHAFSIPNHTHGYDDYYGYDNSTNEYYARSDAYNDSAFQSLTYTARTTSSGGAYSSNTGYNSAPYTSGPSSASTGSEGSASAFTNMQPSGFFNVMIKL